MNSVVGRNKQESSTNQNSNNTISVILCTGATSIKKNSCLSLYLLTFLILKPRYLTLMALI